MSAMNTTGSPHYRATPVTIRDASGRKDAYYIARQWDHYFGVDYDSSTLPYALGHVAGWEESDPDALDAAYGVIAEHGWQVTVPVGFGITELFSSGSLAEQLPAGRFDTTALLTDRNALLQIGAVDPAWRGRGLGEALFKRRLQWLSSHEVEMVLSFGWERRHGRTSRPLFKQWDFVPIQRFDDYYAEDRNACPDCGVWPSNDRSCQCAMTLWARDLTTNPLEDET